MIDTDMHGNPSLSYLCLPRRLPSLLPPRMPITDEEGRVVPNPTRMADPRKDTHPSGAVRRNQNRLATSSNLGGGVGPVRSTRQHGANVLVDADLKTVCFSL